MVTVETLNTSPNFIPSAIKYRSPISGRPMVVPIRTQNCAIRFHSQPRTIPLQAIPRQIVQTWVTTSAAEISPDMAFAMATVRKLNPEYKYTLFDDINCHTFIADNFDSRTLSAYDALVPGAYKADLWRYCYLYKCGGIYMDAKTVGQLPLSMVIAPDSSLFLTLDAKIGSLYNGIMGSISGHPFIQLLIEETVRRIEKRHYGASDLDITGPRMMCDVYRSWTRCDKLEVNPSIGSWVVLDKDAPLTITLPATSRRPVFLRTYSTYYTADVGAGHYSRLWRDRAVYLEPTNTFEHTFPKIIPPRQDIPIANKYVWSIGSHDPSPNRIDFHVAVYYVSEFVCRIIVRRMDDPGGWSQQVRLTIHDPSATTLDTIAIGSSQMSNEKVGEYRTKVRLEKVDLTYQQRIPKVIVQTTKSRTINNKLCYNSIMSFLELNPEYEYRLFDDVDCREFIRMHYQSTTLDVYDMIVPGAFRADLWRYCYLHTNGGCYFDCKMILRRPLRDIVDRQEECMLCLDRPGKMLYNAVMMMTKGNSKCLYCIQMATHHIQSRMHFSSLESVDRKGALGWKKSLPQLEHLWSCITGPGLCYYVFGTKYAYFTHVSLNTDDDNSRYVTFKETEILKCSYMDYYTKYPQNAHYGPLYHRSELYWTNRRILGESIIYVYPRTGGDTSYEFELTNTDVLIKNSRNAGWTWNMQIKIIQGGRERRVVVGPSAEPTRRVPIPLPLPQL